MARYRVTIDRSLCSGFGSCVDAAPTLFAIDGSGVATISMHETDDDSVLDAAASCPMGAIAAVEVKAA
ncbi:MAG TPA: ferredoxin [Gaiellaceae bacterium]|jgi:ferredoxin